MSDLYYAAACQTAFDCPTDRREIADRTARMCSIIENTIIGYEPFFDVRLLVFPEFAHAAPIYDSVHKLRDRLAVKLPNEHTDRYHTLAKKYGCYIQTGSFLEVDDDYPDVVFNATLLICGLAWGIVVQRSLGLHRRSVSDGPLGQPERRRLLQHRWQIPRDLRD